jgi:hypothetical protein
MGYIDKDQTVTAIDRMSDGTPAYIENQKYIEKKLRDHREFLNADNATRRKLIHYDLNNVQRSLIQRAFIDGYKCATRWIDVNDRLPNKDEHVLVVMQDTDKEVHIEIRWRSIYEDTVVDENGFAIYPPVESRVIAWMPIPNYNKI